MLSVNELCKKAQENSLYIQSLTTENKNIILQEIANALIQNSKKIIECNKIDLQNSKDKPKHFLDRLMLNDDRIKGMATGLIKLIDLTDPVGEITDSWTVDNGLKISKIRVPLGVIGIIYEARPNVTADAVGLCLKSGNATVLRGSGDALESNKIIVNVIKDAIQKRGYNPEFIQLIEDTSRDSAKELMVCRDYVDVLIPRGSAGLIRTVVKESTVPVIETGAGNCHAYVHSDADFNMALEIILNGKIQRPSVCNALEKIIIDKVIAQEFIPVCFDVLNKNKVKVLGCEETIQIEPRILKATAEDFYTEFSDLIIAIKVVDDENEAIQFINQHSTKHSEVIITNDNEAAKKFLYSIDSAAVYHNASTRFTDGFEFGFGAEIGISNQKMHARGPLGLKELTSTKYIITGQGQTRK